LDKIEGQPFLPRRPRLGGRRLTVLPRARSAFGAGLAVCCASRAHITLPLSNSSSGQQDRRRLCPAVFPMNLRSQGFAMKRRPCPEVNRDPTPRLRCRNRTWGRRKFHQPGPPALVQRGTLGRRTATQALIEPMGDPAAQSYGLLQPDRDDGLQRDQVGISRQRSQNGLRTSSRKLDRRCLGSPTSVTVQVLTAVPARPADSRRARGPLKRVKRAITLHLYNSNRSTHPTGRVVFQPRTSRALWTILFQR